MKVAAKYSHLGGEEFLLVHHAPLYEELLGAIHEASAPAQSGVDRPVRISSGKQWLAFHGSKALARLLQARGWIAPKLTAYPGGEAAGPAPPLRKSAAPRHFVKEGVDVAVQLGRRPRYQFELFAGHMLLYRSGEIDVGVHILPTKEMQPEMSSGVAYYEGEVYNVLRHGRNNPPVPLLIIGVVP
jgi:hypothetical protein